MGVKEEDEEEEKIVSQMIVSDCRFILQIRLPKVTSHNTYDHIQGPNSCILHSF